MGLILSANIHTYDEIKILFWIYLRNKIYFYYDPEISLFIYISTKNDLNLEYPNLKKVIFEEWYYPTGLFYVQNEYLFKTEDGIIIYSTVEHIDSHFSPT